MAKAKLLTADEFKALRPKLRGRLIAGLEKERTDGALPEWGGPSNSDLWELPPVDSKSVAKLSPIVKEMVGRRLDPRWIRKGGYTSVEEAVDHLVLHLQTHCVVAVPDDAATKAKALSTTH